MTLGQFLTSGYLWGPVALAVILLLILSRHEQKMNSRNNHPSNKFRKHDLHMQKKYGIR